MDAKGRLWISAFGGGLNLYLPESQQFKRFDADPTDPSQLQNDRVIEMFLDGEFIWIASEDGLTRFNTDDYSMLHFSPKTKKLTQEITGLTASDKYFWLTTLRYVLRFDRETFQFDEMKLQTTAQQPIFEPNRETTVARGYIWLTLGGLLYRAESPDNPSKILTLQQVTTDMLNPTMASRKFVRVIADQFGELWLTDEQRKLYQW